MSWIAARGTRERRWLNRVIPCFLLGWASPHSRAEDVLDLGSRLELFVDEHMVQSLKGAALKLERPRDEGIALRFDRPWEGRFCGYVTVIHDGVKDGARDGPPYRCYYRGLPDAGADGSDAEVTCYAESRDGIAWSKPSLGLFEVKGTRENNVILAGLPPFSHNFCPMLDARKGVPPDERFKALAGTQASGLAAFVSADGIRWRKLRENPVFTGGGFDSQNVPFWSAEEQRYLCYFRLNIDGLRRVGRTTSEDFVAWTKPILMRYGAGPLEHIYINQTQPYFRAPQIYVATAARFLPGRKVVTDEQAKEIGVHPSYFGDCSEGVLLTTRGGDRYDRTFLEGFLRPGIGLENWVSRTNYPALGVVPISAREMALYVSQNYGQETSHLRRYSLRTDGFASLSAPYVGGEMQTRPLRFAGKELILNFATSAAGGIRVEVEDAEGKPLPGRSLGEAVELIGNEIERAARWKSGSDLSPFAGRPVRLRFALKDADVYSVRFRE